jgi:hypothetical protein
VDALDDGQAAAGVLAVEKDTDGVTSRKTQHGRLYELEGKETGKKRTGLG